MPVGDAGSSFKPRGAELPSAKFTNRNALDGVRLLLAASLAVAVVVFAAAAAAAAPVAIVFGPPAFSPLRIYGLKRHSIPCPEH